MVLKSVVYENYLESRSELAAALSRTPVGCRSAALGAAQHGAVRRRPVSEDHRPACRRRWSSCMWPTGDGADDIAYPRVIIEAAPGSSATIIEHHVTQGEHDAAEQFQHAHRPWARRAAGALPRVCHGRRRHALRFARHPPGSRTAAASSSPSRWAAAWCAPRSRRTWTQPGASLDSYSLLVGHEDRHVDCVNIVTHARARYAQPSNGARHRQRRRAASFSTAR